VLRLEWDTRKDSQNRRKHGVSFEEALLVTDPDHYEDEDRFVLLGLSSALRTLVVCHCYRTDGDVIRFISARRADRKELEVYKMR